MDDGYMPTWNDCYAKINELYKENLNLRESNGRLENKQIQAQNMIDELEMLRVAQKTIINALTKEIKDLKEENDSLTDLIDYIQ